MPLSVSNSERDSKYSQGVRKSDGSAAAGGGGRYQCTVAALGNLVVIPSRAKNKG